MATKKSTTSKSGRARAAGKNGAEAKKSPTLGGPLAAAQDLAERTQCKDGQSLSASQKDSLLHDCEALVDEHVAGFVAVGIALRIIRDEKLYEKLDYDNFEAYCEDRWDFKRARASQLIAASGVAEAVYNCKQIKQYPCNESQVRPLVSLTAKQQLAVWKRVVKKVGDDQSITAKMVEAEVATLGSKGESNSDAPANAVEEESPADRRKRFEAHCVLLKKLKGQSLSNKQKALQKALQTHGSKFLADVLARAFKFGDKLSKQGACRASAVTGEEIAVGLVDSLSASLANNKVLDLLAPVEDDSP